MSNGINVKNSLPIAPNRSMEKQDKQLKDASKMYEQYFLGEMVKAMRKTVKAGGIMKPSYAEKIYKSQLDSEYVKNWSQSGGVGLGDMIYNQIKEKYFSGMNSEPKGVAPIKKNTQDFKEINVDNFMDLHKSKGAHFQFKPNPGFTHSPEVVAPLDGIVEASFSDSGVHGLKISHGDGLSSQLTFRGRGEGVIKGMTLAAGDHLGFIDPDQGMVDWRLTGLPET